MNKIDRTKHMFKNREIESLYLRIISNRNATHEIWSSCLNEKERTAAQGKDFQPTTTSNNPGIGDNVVILYQRVRNLAIDVAVLELAEQIGLIPKLTYQRLLKELKQKPEKRLPEKKCPSWDRNTGVLSLGNKVLRTVKRLKQAHRIVQILDSFEELGWPERIDDPSPGGKNREQLNNSIRRLNEGLDGIVFFAAGDASSIGWKRIK